MRRRKKGQKRTIKELSQPPKDKMIREPEKKKYADSFRNR